MLRGKNQWPDHPPELKSAYQTYIREVKKVGTAVVHAMDAALDLGFDRDIFVRNTRHSFWVIRMIGCPGLPSSASPSAPSNSDADPEAFSCGEHTDYGCMTLLLADSTTGALQVQTKDGRWINADPVPGAFVVNIGDMMERWTNGLRRSTNHRVIHRGENFRVSVPFFFEPDCHARVRPLRQCVERTGGEERFGEVVYGDHLIARVKGNFH